MKISGFLAWARQEPLQSLVSLNTLAGLLAELHDGNEDPADGSIVTTWPHPLLQVQEGQKCASLPVLILNEAFVDRASHVGPISSNSVPFFVAKFLAQLKTLLD